MSKALFLDRDGVVNINHGYVYQAKNVDFIDGIFSLCRHAINKGYKVFIITNQSGIARGFYDEQTFQALDAWFHKQFLQQSVVITDTFYCPHHPTAGTSALTVVCDCRKPKPGMILQAQQKYNIDLAASVFIGDKLSDMLAAENAGINKQVLFDPNNDHDELNKGNIYKVKTLASAQAFID